MSLSDIFSLIQILLAVISIAISVLIFLLGNKIAKQSQDRAEQKEFDEMCVDDNNKESLKKIVFVDYKIFRRKVRLLKRKYTLRKFQNYFENALHKTSVIPFLKIAKTMQCISWDSNNYNSDTVVSIYNEKKLLRLSKRIYENINSR